MDVEVDQSQSSSGPFGGQEASDCAQLDGAVAADYQRQVPRGVRLPDPTGRFAHDLHDGGEVLRASVALVRPPAPHTATVPVVHHLDARAGEPPEEVGLP